MGKLSNFNAGILVSDISHHFPIFLTRKYFFYTNASKNDKNVNDRWINQNTLSALDIILALTNYIDIISNENINLLHSFNLIELIMNLN